VPERARLSHIGIPVSDLDKSVAFYKKWAAMKVQPAAGDSTGVKGARMAQDSGGFVMPLPMPGIMHIGFDCATKAQVDKIAGDAKKAGILISGPTDAGADLGYQCYIADPDGNNIEFAFGQKVGLTEE
jgi:catechol 2,3-dioxygenase-like lactoylglutathione lyase family enzyme